MSETIDTAQEGIEHAHHAQAHGDGWARRVAVLIAALAAGLALADMGEKSAQNAYLTHHIAVSDDWALYQAKSVRASIRAVEADVLESLPKPADAAAGAALQARLQAARDAEARMRDDPANGDGMKQMADRAKAQTAERDHQFHRYHLFELVVGALQIAIVLASVSVVTRLRLLAWAAGVIGAAAAGFGVLIVAAIV